MSLALRQQVMSLLFDTLDKWLVLVLIQEFLKIKGSGTSSVLHALVIQLVCSSAGPVYKLLHLWLHHAVPEISVQHHKIRLKLASVQSVITEDPCPHKVLAKTQASLALQILAIQNFLWSGWHFHKILSLEFIPQPTFHVQAIGTAPHQIMIRTHHNRPLLYGVTR